MSRRSHGCPKRRPPWWVLYPESYEELKASLTDQPQLRLAELNGHQVIRGRFIVWVKGKRFDSFLVRIVLPERYPRELPVLYLAEKRIDHVPDRHVNSNKGDTCLYVPEEWRAIRPDEKFATWLRLPVRNYFLAQRYFEENGCFPPDGERQHYATGMIDAYAEILGTSTSIKTMHYWLRILSAKTSKGHWRCPCGSRRIIRKCCREPVQAKREALDRTVAIRMLRELEAHIENKKPKTSRRKKRRRR